MCEIEKLVNIVREGVEKVVSKGITVYRVRDDLIRVDIKDENRR